MGDIFTPGNVIVALIVAIGLVAGTRRAIRGLARGESCCTEGSAPASATPADVDESRYPYAVDLGIAGMSCEGCAARVAAALNGLEGVRATVDLATATAHVRSGRPVDRGACADAVRAAGYRVREL